MDVNSGGYNMNGIIKNHTFASGRFDSDINIANNINSPILENMVDENCEDFFNYLERLGLASDSNLLVIPSTHHYYYDADDLKEVNTVINLKQLNHIKQIRDFLHTIGKLLPNKSNFVGCFIDNKVQNGFSDKYNNLPGQNSDKEEVYENNIESRIPFLNRMYNFIDSRTNRYLTRRSVTQLLEECGLQIVGMTELNGLTYFCTRKNHPSAA